MKVKVKRIILILVLIALFVPDGMSTIGAEDKILKASFLGASYITSSIKLMYWGRNLSCIVLTFWYLFRKLCSAIRGKWQTKSTDVFCVFGIWVLYVSVINKIEVYNLFIIISVCIGILCLSEIMSKYNQKMYLDVLYSIIITLLSINLLLCIMYPNGITTGIDYLSTPYYFLGNKNQITPLLILGLFLIYNNDKYNSIQKLTRSLIIVFNALIMGSSTSILCVFIFFAIIFYYRKRNNTNSKILKNGRKSIFIAIGIMIGIVFFKIQLIFSWLIIGILGKDLSFSGRLYIWEEAIEQFLSKPLTGYGYGHTVQLGLYAHNILIELLVTTGIVGLACYCIFIVCTVSWKMKYKESASIIPAIAALIALVYANTMESFIYNIPQMFFLGIVAYIANKGRVKGG